MLGSLVNRRESHLSTQFSCTQRAAQIYTFLGLFFIVFTITIFIMIILSYSLLLSVQLSSFALRSLQCTYNSLSVQDMKYVKHELSTTTRKQESRDLSFQDNDYKHLMSTYFSFTQRAAQITSSARSTSFQRRAKFNSITREIVQIQTFLSLMSIFC